MNLDKLVRKLVSSVLGVLVSCGCMSSARKLRKVQKNVESRNSFGRTLKVVSPYLLPLPFAGVIYLGYNLIKDDSCSEERQKRGKDKDCHSHVVKYDECKDYEMRKKSLWCVPASIVNVLKSSGVKMTQEDVSSMIPEVINRGRNAFAYGDACQKIAKDNNLFFCSAQVVCLGHHKVVKHDKTVEEEPVEWEKFSDHKQLKDVILKFYELIGKRTFFILDSAYGVGKDVIAHMVNVIRVSNDEIVIFDNLDGKIRREKILDFVKKYLNQYQYGNDCVGFVMGSFIRNQEVTSDKRDWLDHVYWYLRGNTGKLELGDKIPNIKN